jgi:hypothetical protein
VRALRVCQSIVQEQHRTFGVRAEPGIAVLRATLETPAPDELLLSVLGPDAVKEAFVISDRRLQAVKDQSLARTDGTNVKQRVL